MTDPRERPAGEAAAWAGPVRGRPMKWAEVDTGALRDNAAAIRGHVGPGPGMIAMVKANGYGHGAVLAARAFLEGGATALGVSSPEEAIQLRRAGIEAPVLAVGWTHPTTHAELLAAGIEVTVYDSAAVEALASAARATGQTALVHLKVDTGMNRLGAPLADVEALLAAIAAGRPRLRLAGIFTHFADADGVDPGFTEVQHGRFLGVVEAARAVEPSVLVHCANSAATLGYPAMRHDAVRPGIALYGYPPPGATGVVALRPALTVVATVTQVKTVLPGETVGYGRTWTAIAPTRVATIAAGYADGVQRSQSNRGVVLVHGVHCPIVGRVSMDQIGVDVSAVPAVRQGDEAMLLGGRGDAWLGADEVAARVETISYEVLCAVSPRIRRMVVGQTAQSRRSPAPAVR